MLSKQLRGAATELRRLNVLEDRAKLWVLLRRIGQLSGHVAIFRRGAETEEQKRSIEDGVTPA